ncbi:uncharacterized protein NDAI_0B00500 [Naumovozyma dairenensis CBS 421]|uniref:Uncharacterized protein n=1 Tax=Naumovozyma dairenensis (strain ATCC 10597 / BCRC 20456 / CBS 421 / NBRC 0211 / NRRL Y-12639) TaxID=1071378 RepID=G0W5M3_NAUDC|nr:hypothetical protein NDAI_0B00500 [Naumovozyma dairenensis CBS 421]CCD23084.1 hypothetical protein NDAI_0B00500 [Naumovozyma dairenensis CBS 421]
MSQQIIHPIFYYDKDALKSMDEDMSRHMSYRSKELPSKASYAAFTYRIIEIIDGSIKKISGEQFFECLGTGGDSTRIFLVPSFYHALYKAHLDPNESVGTLFYKDQYLHFAKAFFLKVGCDVVVSLESGIFDSIIPGELLDEFGRGITYRAGIEWYFQRSICRLTLLFQKGIEDWEGGYRLPTNKTTDEFREEINSLTRIDELLDRVPKTLLCNFNIADGIDEDGREEIKRRILGAIIVPKKTIFDSKGVLYNEIHPQLPSLLFAALVVLIQTGMKLVDPVLTSILEMENLSKMKKVFMFLIGVCLSNAWFLLIPSAFQRDAVDIIHYKVRYLYEVLKGYVSSIYHFFLPFFRWLNFFLIDNVTSCYLLIIFSFFCYYFHYMSNVI